MKKLEDLRKENEQLVNKIEKALLSEDRLRARRASKKLKALTAVFGSYYKTDGDNLYYYDSLGQMHFIDYKSFFNIIKEKHNSIICILEN